MKYLKAYLIKGLILILLGYTLNSCEQTQDEDLEFPDRFTGNVILNSQSAIDDFGAKQYKEITGYLYIGSYDDNGKQITPFDTDITNISSLNTIERIRGDMFIRGNPILSDLNGLENLKIIEGFLMKISLNENLTKIDGFNNLESIGQTLLVVSNMSLVNFCGLQTILENDPNIEYHVSNNSFNPRSEDIINNCSQ